jgi:hypothetical protein
MDALRPTSIIRVLVRELVVAHRIQIAYPSASLTTWERTLMESLAVCTALEEKHSRSVTG